MTQSLSAAPELAMAPRRAESEDPVARLTHGLATGNEAAFREFHTLYFDRLYRYLLVISHGDETLARDGLQEMLVRVARHARRFDEEKAFWDWLAVLGRSCVVDGGRKQSRYRRLLALFRHDPPPPARPADALLFDALESSLGQLEEPDLRLLHRKYTDGYTAGQLARESGLSEGAVESRLVRIRSSLRRSILRQLCRQNES